MRRAGGGRRGAFTLVELLMAMTVAALVALSATAMLSATAYGTSSRRSMSALLVKSRTVNTRLAAAIRTSLEVVDVGANHLVLWVDDTNGDETKQNDEMQLIERDTDAAELNSYRDTSDTAAFADAGTFRAAALASYTAECWATGVSGMTLAVDASPPDTKLVSFQVTFAAEDMSETTIGAAALR